MDNSRVIHVTEGKGKSTLEDIRQHLESKGVKHDQVKQISMDLSPAFIAGSITSFPSAEITFDRFHVVKLLNVAMDKVRKSERLEHDGLKGQKYTFLKNRENLSEKQEKSLTEMITLYPTLGEAYHEVMGSDTITAILTTSPLTLLPRGSSCPLHPPQSTTAR